LNIFKLTQKINALFLSIVLIAGTIAATSPFFMVGNAQAEPYNGIDKDRNISVNSLRCNNINVNVNGLELEVYPSFLGGNGDIAAEATQEDSIGAASFADDGGSNGDRSQINDFRFICINNNNNTVIGGEEPVQPIDGCEECFTENIIEEVQITNFTGTLVIYTEFGDLEGLCEFLSDPTITNNEKIAELVLIFSRTNIPTDIRLSILECLDEREIIVFPQDSRL
jgi:hypothetical protein